MLRSALACTVVDVVFDVLFTPFGSVVPSEVTVAEFERTVPSLTPAPTVTWIVNSAFAPLARPVVFVHVTTCPTAEQPTVDPADWNVVPAGSVSETWNPPVLS